MKGEFYAQIISENCCLVCFCSDGTIFSLTSYAATSNVDRTVTISGITYAIEKSENGVVTVTDKDTGGVAVFNKNTGILTVKERPDSKEVVININDLINNASKGSNSSSDNKYAYSNYLKYYNGKPYTFWQIQIPDQIKYTYEKTMPQTFIISNQM